MEPSSHIMDLTRAAAVELGLLNNLMQPSQPTAPVLPNLSNPRTTSAEHIMDFNSFSFLIDGITDMSWDNVPSKIQPVNPTSVLDFNSNESPAMSLCTPTADVLRSPVSFDVLGLDELGASPSVSWQSPLDDSAYASQQSQDGFDFDFSVDVQQIDAWSGHTDFQLFEDKPTITNLEQLLMAPTPDDADLAIIKESPAEYALGCFSPIESAVPSPSVGDYSDLFNDSTGVTEAMATGTGYRPPKRQRRRRRTCEDEARVYPEDTSDDPNVRPRYKCSVCDKTFTRPFNLRSHRAIHAGVKPFTCTHTDAEGEVCGWSFARRHDLERHTQSRHSARKQFKCMTCGTECARNDAYRRHLQRHPACASAAELMKEDLGFDQDITQEE